MDCHTFTSLRHKRIARFEKFFESGTTQGITVEQYPQQVDTGFANIHVWG
jgi:hypothetical protein